MRSVGSDAVKDRVAQAAAGLQGGRRRVAASSPTTPGSEIMTPRSAAYPMPGRLTVCHAGRVSTRLPPQAEQRIRRPTSGAN